MNLSTVVLGSTAVKHLQTTTSEYVLRVGSDRLTRAELAGVGCFNFVAARNLSSLLADNGTPAKNLAHLYESVSPTSLALPHMGVISLAVLGAAFEAKGIGGDAPLENWVRKHSRPDQSGEAHMTTWHSIKRHELAEISREQTARKDRTRARRNKAHGLRVERFTTRRQRTAAADARH